MMIKPQNNFVFLLHLTVVDDRVVILKKNLIHYYYYSSFLICYCVEFCELFQFNLVCHVRVLSSLLLTSVPNLIYIWFTILDCTAIVHCAI